MKVFFKLILWMTLVIATIILPAYIWSIIDRESYENFLLKGISPLTQKSRSSILQKRSSNSEKLKNF